MTRRKPILFQDTVLRRDAAGTLYLMNKPETGWRSSCFRVDSVEACERQYACTVGEWTRDEHGECAPVSRFPRARGALRG